jgi:hypothetical protein
MALVARSSSSRHLSPIVQGAARWLLAWVIPASGVLLVSGGTYALLTWLLPSLSETLTAPQQQCAAAAGTSRVQQWHG